MRGDTNYHYSVTLDDEKVYDVINTQPGDFDKMYVYATLPDAVNAQSGKIRNVMIKTKPGEDIVHRFKS